MSSVVVEHNGHWVVADLEVDPSGWARDLVRQRAREERLSVRRKRIGLLVRLIVDYLESSRAEDPQPVMVLFLYPVADEPVVTSVKIRAESLVDSMTLDEIADDMRYPAQMLEQPTVEEAVETRSGQALHMVQRYLDPVDPELEMVMEHEVYAWVLDDEDGPVLVMLSTAYVDLVAAGQWRSELRDLAETLVLKRA
jgi:hypothetical protein